MTTVLKNKKGLTLIEVLISLVITLVLFMALMQSALLSISMNTGNVLRDEAVRIAESRMNELRGTSYNSLTAGIVLEADILRNVRNFPQTFTPTVTIIDLGTTAKRIDVLITWDWKEKTVAGGNPYTHLVSTLKRNPIP